MKKMVAVGLVGLAAGLVMPGVFAQAPQPQMQKWEQFCEEVNPKNKSWAKSREAINARMAALGRQGYQLFAVEEWVYACYRRPAQ